MIVHIGTGFVSFDPADLTDDECALLDLCAVDIEYEGGDEEGMNEGTVPDLTWNIFKGFPNCTFAPGVAVPPPPVVADTCDPTDAVRAWLAWRGALLAAARTMIANEPGRIGAGEIADALSRMTENAPGVLVDWSCAAPAGTLDALADLARGGEHSVTVIFQHFSAPNPSAFTAALHDLASEHGLSLLLANQASIGGGLTEFGGCRRPARRPARRRQKPSEPSES